MVYFYALTYDTEFNPNMVFYVGKTVSKEQRLSGHKATFGKNWQLCFTSNWLSWSVWQASHCWSRAVLDHFRLLCKLFLPHLCIRATTYLHTNIVGGEILFLTFDFFISQPTTTHHNPPLTINLNENPNDWLWWVRISNLFNPPRPTTAPNLAEPLLSGHDFKVSRGRVAVNILDVRR